MNLTSLLSILNNKSIEYDLLKKRRFKNKILLHTHTNLLTSLEKAKLFLIEISKESQKETIILLEKVVTSCISIYNEPNKIYTFGVEIKPQHNQEEFHFFIKENELKYYLRENTLNIAGGIIDMTAFGLRIGLHSLDPDVEPILFLDEPFKSLANKVLEGGEIAQYWSKELNIQIIIITHNKELKRIANKVISIGEDYLGEEYES